MVARLEALGARRLQSDAIEKHGNRWVVMADPEGNESCVCNAGQHA
jgi:Glyoxalase-like domain